jgi:hypothetical protein
VNGWTVELTKSAQREFRQLEDGPEQAASDLAEDPSMVPSIELRANPQIWRARFHQDRYRMIYPNRKKPCDREAYPRTDDRLRRDEELKLRHWYSFSFTK